MPLKDTQRTRGISELGPLVLRSNFMFFENHQRRESDLAHADLNPFAGGLGGEQPHS